MRSYDPQTDSWTAVASLSSPRDALAACVLGGRLLVAGGFDGQNYLPDAESYDPHTNEWTKVRTTAGLVGPKGVAGPEGG